MCNNVLHFYPLVAHFSYRMRDLHTFPLYLTASILFSFTKAREINKIRTFKHGIIQNRDDLRSIHMNITFRPHLENQFSALEFCGNLFRNQSISQNVK